MKKLRIKSFILILIAVFMIQNKSLNAQNSQLGIFSNHADIGNLKFPGTVAYNAETQTFTVTSSGKNIWFAEDEFHYLYSKIKGDFILRATVEFIGKGTEPHRKIGWMVRNNLNSNSAHVSSTVHGDGLTSIQWRAEDGINMDELTSISEAPTVIQLERKGMQFIMKTTSFGKSFITDQITHVALSDEVYVGLFVCAHNSDVVEKAIFKNVRIIKPASKDFVPYNDYIGSNLEILDMDSYTSRIVYSSPKSIQAPNWTPDNKSLIFNSEGLLFNFNLKTSQVNKINTEFAINNNNDHVLSLDGKILGISHHSKDDGNNSIIYTLPVSGGMPKRITAKGPSYLHGFSPDGKWLVYTGGRDNSYNLYKISINGGQEIQLTNTSWLDDGSEYTPDGNYIYFHSGRTGTTKLWRMKPDGTDQQQITFDEFQDWFPHISPDGKWIVFLSFDRDVKTDDHPFYKQVYLRLMPITGGESKIIACLYGGQGTINVPSWSPDGKKIAFVSNSKLDD